MKGTAEEMAEDKLDSIHKLMEIREKNPAMEAKALIKMVEQILYPSGNKWKEDDEEEPEKEYYNKRGKSMKTRIASSDDFSQRYELIGKIRGEFRTARNEKYMDNPWGIIIGQYQKCPVCEKVSVTTLKRDFNHNANKTYIRKTYVHFDSTEHGRLSYDVTGDMLYEDIVKLYKTGIDGRDEPEPQIHQQILNNDEDEDDEVTLTTSNIREVS